MLGSELAAQLFIHPNLRNPMPKKRYLAAGGVVIHDGRMLVLDRPSRGEVRLPKGHIEGGEDAAEIRRCVRRWRRAATPTLRL